MSEYGDEYDDDSNETEGANGPKALRDALAKSRKAEKDALKRLADLEAKQADYDKAARATTLSESLKAAGVKDPAKVAKLYPSDGEATAEAVTQWVADYKDVLNIGTAPAGEATEESPEAPRQPVDPTVQHYLDSQHRSSELEREASEGPLTDERIAAAFAEIEKTAKSPEDISAGLRQLGINVPGGYQR